MEALPTLPLAPQGCGVVGRGPQASRSGSGAYGGTLSAPEDMPPPPVLAQMRGLRWGPGPPQPTRKADL